MTLSEQQFPKRGKKAYTNRQSVQLFNFAIKYAIMRVQTNQKGFKFNHTLQLLVYADDNLMGQSTRTVNKGRSFISRQ